MTDHYDALETRAPAEREAALFARLPNVLRKAMAAPAYAERLKGTRSGFRDRPGRAGAAAGAAQIGTPRPAQGRAALRRLRPEPPGSFGRLFTSPGPIFEPEPAHRRSLARRRALFAAGFRPGDVVLNTFSYHLTPGGFIFDASARALGCAVIPAGPGNTEAAVRADRGLPPDRL